MDINDFTDEQRELYQSLTPLQKNVTIGMLHGLNQTDAYIAAGGEANGYDSQRAAASYILAVPNVKKLISLVQNQRFSDAVMSQEEMAARLSSMARTQISDVVNTHIGRELVDMETGEIIKGQTFWSLKPVQEMANGGLSAISEMTATKDGLKIKLHDQKAAMDQLSKLKGYNAPVKKEHSGPGGGPVKIIIADDESDL